MTYKVIHYLDKCIGCMSCVAVCPKYWAEDGQKSKLIGGKKTGNKAELTLDKDLKCNKEAEQACPTDAIKVKEQN
jgi:ferredoxin